MGGVRLQVLHNDDRQAVVGQQAQQANVFNALVRIFIALGLVRGRSAKRDEAVDDQKLTSVGKIRDVVARFGGVRRGEAEVLVILAVLSCRRRADGLLVQIFLALILSLGCCGHLGLVHRLKQETVQLGGCAAESFGLLDLTFARECDQRMNAHLWSFPVRSSSALAVAFEFWFLCCLRIARTIVLGRQS